jgi:uncharacterized protein
MKNHRRCVGCRRVADRQEFWRVVRVNGVAQLDEGLGRSAYLCPNPNCLAAARKKNTLARALKATVTADIYQSLNQRFSDS